MLSFTYDAAVDAAYITLADQEDSVFAETETCDDSGWEINVDISVGGLVIGVEILDASHVLPLDLVSRLKVAGFGSASAAELGISIIEEISNSMTFILSPDLSTGTTRPCSFASAPDIEFSWEAGRLVKIGVPRQVSSRDS